MASVIYKDCKLYLGGYDLSGDMNKCALSYGAEMKDDTVFNDDTRSNKAGLLTVGAAHEGYWQADTDLVDDIIDAKFAVADEIMTICPTTGAAGEVAFSFKSLLANYNPNGAVGDLYAFSVDATGTGKLFKGTVMENATKTSTATGTARQLGAVTDSQKVYAALHVLAVEGTDPTLDVVIQSDNAEGFLSAADKITFTQMTDIGAQLLTADGAIADDWWRVSWTVGGTDNPSFTIVVVVGIL